MVANHGLVCALGSGLAAARDGCVARLTRAHPVRCLSLVESGHVHSTRRAHGGAGAALVGAHGTRSARLAIPPRVAGVAHSVCDLVNARLTTGLERPDIETDVNETAPGRAVCARQPPDGGRVCLGTVRDGGRCRVLTGCKPLLGAFFRVSRSASRFHQRLSCCAHARAQVLGMKNPENLFGLALSF